MTRNVASDLTLAAAVAIASVSGGALAESPFPIIGDNSQVMSSRSRAEVQAEFMRQSESVRSGANEWSRQFNQLPNSDYSSDQAREERKAAREKAKAEYNATRHVVDPFSAEIGVNATAIMGGPAR